MSIKKLKPLFLRRSIVFWYYWRSFKMIYKCFQNLPLGPNPALERDVQVRNPSAFIRLDSPVKSSASAAGFPASPSSRSSRRWMFSSNSNTRSRISPSRFSRGEGMNSVSPPFRRTITRLPLLAQGCSKRVYPRIDRVVAGHLSLVPHRSAGGISENQC